MGLFSGLSIKKIGNAISGAVKGATKMISFKNGVKALTGGVAGLGKEAIGRVVKGATGSSSKAQQVTDSRAGQVASDYIDAQAANLGEQAVNYLSSNPKIQKAADDLTKITFKIWWAGFYQKNKAWIIGLGVTFALGLMFLFNWLFLSRARGKR